MITKLSFKNLRKSVKDYTIYFFTLVLGVAIFYIFNSIDSQTLMFDINSRKYEIVNLLNQLLSFTSVFVSFILGSLIIYASRFLIKRRNKEFGIYLSLGMSKRKISLILFLETLFIGIISLGVGLLLGCFLSQFMSILVAKLFDADMKNFHFIFSYKAALKTLIYFGIMYVLVMIFNTLIISKCKLIDLLYSKRKNEKIRIKNPWLCIIIFIISSAVLGYAYYMVTDGVFKLKDFKDIAYPIIMGVVSTFLIFWSVSGLILKIVMSLKKLYYKGLNSFMLRQLSSKVNTTVVSMTFICLMLFITICALSSSLALRNSLIANIDELSPADIQVMTNYKENEDNLTVIDKYKNNKFNYQKYVKKYASGDIYIDENFSYKSSLGNAYEEIKKAYGLDSNHDYLEPIMKLSDYNKYANLFHKEELRLDKDEYVLVANFETVVDIHNIALKNGTKINIFNHRLKPKYTKCIDGFIEIGSNKANTGVFIVDDSVLDDKPYYNIFTAVYNETNRDKKYEIDKLFINQNGYIGTSSYITKTSIEDSSVGLGAIVTFLGIYLGIIFLISSAAILALKNLSEASDNKERYIILRSIGADEQLIKKSLFRETFIFFMFPLVLAIIHSIFGIRFSLLILSTFGKDGLLKSVIMTVILILIVYGGYFLITYQCSKNIIKDKNYIS